MANRIEITLLCSALHPEGNRPEAPRRDEPGGSLDFVCLPPGPLRVARAEGSSIFDETALLTRLLNFVEALKGGGWHKHIDTGART